MKAKLSSIPKVFSSIKTRHFLATIILTTIAIIVTDFLLTKKEK
jgi:hypothetical protein